MSRVPCLSDEALPETLRSLSQGRVINLYRVLAHAPQVEQIAAFGASLFAGSSTIDPVDRELLILTFGVRYQSEYEWTQHIPISRSLGVTDEQRAALRREDYGAAVFTPAQRALLRFAVAAIDGPTVDDAVYADVAAHYSDEQIVEILVLAGFYFLVARVTTVLDVEIDAPDGDEVLQMAKAFQAG